MKNTIKKTFFAVGLLLSASASLYSGPQICGKQTGQTSLCINIDTKVATCSMVVGAGSHNECNISQNSADSAGTPSSEGNAIGDVAHDFMIKNARKINDVSKVLIVPVPTKKGSYALYSFVITTGNDKGKTVYFALRNEKLSPELQAKLAAEGKDTLLGVWVNVGNYMSKNKNNELKREFVDIAEITLSSKKATEPIRFSIQQDGRILGGGADSSGEIASFTISSDLHTENDLAKTN